MADEDWMLDSLQKYESLYMYELHHPTRCLDWTKGGSAICVAGFSTELNNEILQLSIPEKLLPADRQSLCARRDFKMINGALTKVAITALKSLEPSKFLLASCGSSSSIDLWTEDPQKSDMLQKAGEIHLKSSHETLAPHVAFLDHTKDCPTSLLVGSAHSLDTVQLIDINTKQLLFEVAGSTQNEGSHSNKMENTTPLHGLAIVGGVEGHVFITCSGEEGRVKLWDIREHVSENRTRFNGLGEHNCSKDEKTTTSSIPPAYAVSVSNTCTLSDNKIAVLCGSGQVVLYDSRNINVPIVKCCVGEKDELGAFRSRFATAGRSARLCVQLLQWPLNDEKFSFLTTSLGKNLSKFLPSGSVKKDLCFHQFSPSHKSLLSISGLNKGIQVYDTSNWTDQVTHAPSPVFTHEGHEKESPGTRVLVHSWQVGVTQTTIFSADSDGSLHAWEWKHLQ